MATRSQPISEFVSHLSKTFNPKKQRSGMLWWIYQGIWAAPVHSCSCPQLFLHFIHAWTPLTCAWTPTPCDAPFPQEGESGDSLLNPVFKVMWWKVGQRSNTERQMVAPWETFPHVQEGCEGIPLPLTCCWGIEDEMKGFDWSRSMMSFQHVTKVIWGFSLCSKYRFCKYEHLPLSRWARKAVQC